PDPRLVEPDARCDQIDVVTESVRFPHDRFEILAQQRLAAGKAELNRAERARLAQDAQPVTGSEFLAGARELRRVRAVRAMQRAAVRELEQQPQGRPRSSRCQIAGAAAHARISSHLLSTARFTNAVTS